MENRELTVRETAVRSGFSAHTLRYYERVGLLGPIGRARSGHRRYSEQDIAWIEFLVRLRTTGMPIRKMKRFADLRRKGEATIAARRALLEEHRAEVRGRVVALESDLAVIDDKVELYGRLEARNVATTGTDGRDTL